MPKPDCSELAKTITQLAFNIGTRPEIKTLADVTAEMQKSLPGITRDEIVRSINEATSGHREAKSELQKKVDNLKREARRDKALREAAEELGKHVAGKTQPKKTFRKRMIPKEIEALKKQVEGLRDQLRNADPARRDAIRARIAELEGHLKAGTIPPKRAVGDVPEDIQALRTARDAVLKELRKSEPALKEKFEKQIEDLTERLENGVEAPEPAEAEKLMSSELERLAYERDKLRREIRQRIDALKPKTWWGRKLAPAVEGINLARAVMTSFDLSAVLRQGGFITLGNPVRAAKSIVPMLRAFASPVKSHAIHQEIDARPNAPLYARSGLYMAPEEGAELSQKEEAFMSRLAGKVPFVAGSQRAYNTFLNKLRADSFDAMAATLARNGEPTLEEMRAIASYINVATGRGSLGPLEGAAQALNTVFFAPRYVASRFQILAQPLMGFRFGGGSARTRKLFAAEYAKMLMGLGIVMGLGMLAGGDVEKDPRSSDFAKIRFGNTRIDPLMGLHQVIRPLAQIVSGSKKVVKTGKIVPIRGKNIPYRGDTVRSTVWNFLQSKAAPLPDFALNLAGERDAFGQELTTADTVGRMVVPLSVRDVVKTMESNGIPRGTAMTLLGLLGMGVQTYGKEEAEGRESMLGF